MRTIARARLDQKPENVALVDGSHRRGKIRLARQHDANRVGALLANQRKKLDPVHARHAEVGNHRGKGALFGEDSERVLGAGGRDDRELPKLPLK